MKASIVKKSYAGDAPEAHSDTKRKASRASNEADRQRHPLVDAIRTYEAEMLRYSAEAVRGPSSWR
jgi:hypothetical protein